MGGYAAHLRPVVDRRCRHRLYGGRSRRTLDPFEEIVVNAGRRVPEFEDVRVTRLMTARRRFPRPTASSASERPPPAPAVVAAGFCAHGLAGAGGMGR